MYSEESVNHRKFLSRYGFKNSIVVSGRGEEVEKGNGMVNIVYILCTHVCKWKNDTC
jgi:hypothetical protein